MPRYAHYQLRWSEQAQNYVLSIGEQTSQQALSDGWLEQVASFAFSSRSGMHYTVRKQRARRGNSYWYGYRRLGGRIVKQYLGRTADLTLARLEEIARDLESKADGRQPSFPPDQRTTLLQSSSPILRAGDTPHSSHVSPAVAPPLLLSKLSPPRLHSGLLDRARLFALLDAGRECHLTLLSAPAGSGKTTLVGQWIAARRAQSNFPPAAWVSLEAADNDPARFWRYLIAACQAFQADVQEAYRALADALPQPPFVPSSLETMLTGLLNALARCPSGGILVLEDYHVITSPEIHTSISFFLDHLPPNLHLIMITRSDPPFSLARLRAGNNLYEIRAADLRFSQEEMVSLLQPSLSFPLSTESIQRLHAQLEGWGAGLHLVKLALQRASTQAEAERALALFTGNNPSLQEYFVTEVLDLQSEPVQQFLLQTSILNRLTGSLCDAVVGQQDSQDMLVMLERANLFLEPLDGSGQWYRYHALFSEAMHNEARRRVGEGQLRLLSVRASRWYEEHGMPDEAIDAALAAQDYGRAASLIERFVERQISSDEMRASHTLHRWFEQIPETILLQYPALCLSYVTTLLFLSASWRPDRSIWGLLEKLLSRAEQCFRDENNLPKLGEVFAFRSLLAWRLDETRAAATYAQQALDWLPETQRIWRVLSLCMVGREWIEQGQFRQAYAISLEAYILCETVENTYLRVVSTIQLAMVCFEQGEIQRASTLYRQALAVVREDVHAGALCAALIGLASLTYERNELESAYQYAQKALELSQPRGLLAHEVHAVLIQARVLQVQGLMTEAQQRLAALFERISPISPQLAQEIQTAQAALALATGDHMTMQRWISSRQPRHALEEELLLARWLRIQGQPEKALPQLERLLATAQEAGHTRCVLAIQAEMALVTVACKRKTEAQQLLRAVLAQAFSENYMRLFLDAGEPMALLLRSLIPQLTEQPLSGYMRTMLNSFPAQPQGDGLASSLVEPLSSQEMRVLRLLVQHRSNAEIADALVVSINTVRTQVQSIYRKLGVHKRSAAAEIARNLHLL